MSTSDNPSAALNASQYSGTPPLDWRYPFLNVTAAFVAAGAFFLSRAIFPGPWRAEVITLLTMCAWGFWARRIDFPPARQVKGTARQSLVDALAGAFCFFVFFSWPDGLTAHSWGGALVGAFTGAMHSALTRSTSPSPKRTIPKPLAVLREIVKERGERLRALSAEELQKLASEPSEKDLVAWSRPATIEITVQSKPDGVLRVVIKGFMKSRFILGKHVALDGFYKHADGTVSNMPNEEFRQFD